MNLDNRVSLVDLLLVLSVQDAPPPLLLRPFTLWHAVTIGNTRQVFV
jgi:hypothetical protein